MGSIRVGLEDAKDFFYLLQMPEARVQETMIGRPVSCRGLFRKLGVSIPSEFAGEQMVSLLLLSPAMGDQKSVDIAQGSHTHSLDAHGALLGPQWMTFGFAPPGT
eukprot:5904481-Amphidinium_carterae.1